LIKYNKEFKYQKHFADAVGLKARRRRRRRRSIHPHIQ